MIRRKLLSFLSCAALSAWIPGGILRARKVFAATEEQREMVLILAGALLPHSEIALRLGLSVEMLQKHFADELKMGPVKCRTAILHAMFCAGAAGNVSAARVYLLFNRKNEMG